MGLSTSVAPGPVPSCRPCAVQKVYAPRQQESTVFRRMRSVVYQNPRVFSLLGSFPPPGREFSYDTLDTLTQVAHRSPWNAPRASARVVVHAIGTLVLLGKVRGKWGLAPWPQTGWPRGAASLATVPVPFSDGVSR